MSFPNTTFVPKSTIITSTWLQAVNDRLTPVVDVNGIVTKPELAAQSGASLVGYMPAGTDAKATTVEQQLRRGAYNIMNQMTQAEVNDVLARTKTLDVSAAFIRARTYCHLTGRKMYAPAGTYKMNTASVSTQDLILEGDGDTTVFDFSGTVTGGSTALEAIGTATQIQELSGTQTIGTNTVTFVSAPSLAVGDVFVIYNPTDSSWSGFRTYYRAGEWCEVESISGNVVTTRSQLFDTYSAADVDVYKITSPRVNLKNFKVVGTTVSGLIGASLCISPLLENISGTHQCNSIISFDRCFKPVCNNPNISNKGTELGDDYGIAISNSQHSRVSGGYAYGRRHAITHGGNAEICCVPVRDSIVSNVIIKNDKDSNIFAADFHGNTEASSFIDCTIYGGASWQGKDVGYVNCTIYSDNGGRVLMSAEIKGGDFYLRGCKLITYVNPANTGRGIVDIGRNSDAVTSSTTLPATFSVTDSSIYGRNMGAGTQFMAFRNAGTSVKINLVVDGVTADVNRIQSILETNVTTGTPASDFIIVDRVSNFPAGTFLHLANGATNYATFPHRCQKQTGKQTLTTTTSAAFVTGTLTSFKYVYPRAPSAHCTTVGGYAGNRMAFGTLDALTTTQIQPMIESGDATNWAAAVPREVCWTASLDEV